MGWDNNRGTVWLPCSSLLVVDDSGGMLDGALVRVLAAPVITQGVSLAARPEATVSFVKQQRGPEDFARLYEAEYDRLVRIAYLVLGSREQAEEVTQDAFVRLHGRFTLVANPPAYLRTAVMNGCHDVHRRLARYRRREPSLYGGGETFDAPDELADVLDRLRPRQRAALVLRYYEGMSERDIADALGVRVGTVKSLLSRGIDQLRKELPS